MNTSEIPRIAAPLLLAVAIVVSWPRREAVPPVELPPGEAPAPSAGETLAGFARATAPGAPGYDRGSVRAPVTVVEFADFGCRYCARFATEVYPRLADEFVTTGKVRWKYVPFVLGMFPNGDGAARAAECAAEQGKTAFGRMHDLLYARRPEWSGAADPAGSFRAYAAAAFLDEARFARCYGSEATGARLRASNELADQLGVRATPTFFVDGARVEGALPLEQFRAVLRDALAQRRAD